MGITYQRGQIEDLAVTDKDGTGSCRINNQQVKVHPNLIPILEQGDDVFVAGKLNKKNNILKAYAVNNIKKERVATMDSAFYILLMGLGFFLAIFFSVTGARHTNEILEILSNVIAISGLVLAYFGIRITLLINKASVGVKYPD